jgi:hypothetical protein
MKAIICHADCEVRIFTFGTEWTACPCGKTKAKWLDACKGTVVVASECPERVRLLGMNNDYLIAAIRAENISWEIYQKMHEQASDAPGYLFNKDKCACWAVVCEVGRSNDVRWATPDEHAEAFAKIINVEI